MLNNSEFYRRFLGEINELRNKSGVPLAEVILPTDFEDIVSGNFKLQERFNIINNRDIGIDIIINNEYNADMETYSIKTTKKYNDHSSFTGSVTIIVSSIQNSDEVSLYMGIITYSGSAYNHVYNYCFIRKNKNGIVMFDMEISMNSGDNSTYKINKSKITETFYNSETSEYIGDAYLNPTLLKASHLYGIKYDSSATYTDVLSLKEMFELFNNRCAELLGDNYSKSIAKSSETGDSNGR